MIIQSFRSDNDLTLLYSSQTQLYPFLTGSGFDTVSYQKDSIDGDIPSSGYNNTGINSVRVGASCGFIGDEAFESCSISELNFQEGVTGIGAFSFADNRISYLKMPESLVEIDSGCFSNALSQASVEFNSTLTSIPERAFFNCSFSTLLDIPSNITSLSEESFGYCFFGSGFNIPSSIDKLPLRCFIECNITDNDLNIDTQTIGSGAFLGFVSDGADITVSTGVTSIEDFAFSNVYIENGQLNFNPSNNYIPKDCFNSSYIDKLVIGDNITNIKPSAFYKFNPSAEFLSGNERTEYITDESKIVLGNSITGIESGAFEDCFAGQLYIYNIPASGFHDNCFDPEIMPNCFTASSISIPSLQYSTGIIPTGERLGCYKYETNYTGTSDFSNLDAYSISIDWWDGCKITQYCVENNLDSPFSGNVILQEDCQYWPNSGNHPWTGYAWTGLINETDNDYALGGWVLNASGDSLSESHPWILPKTTKEKDIFNEYSETLKPKFYDRINGEIFWVGDVSGNYINLDSGASNLNIEVMQSGETLAETDWFSPYGIIFAHPDIVNQYDDDWVSRVKYAGRVLEWETETYPETY
jgi:hypothetical protein